MTALKPGRTVLFTDGRDGPARVRTGKVWSAAPGASSYWVVPDDDPRRRAVCVKMPTQRMAEQGALPEAVAMATQDDRDLTMRRVKALAGVPRLFGTVDLTQPALDGTEPITYHADRNCAAAKVPGVRPANKHGREATIATWKASNIVAGKHAADVQLCRRCVYLEES